MSEVLYRKYRARKFSELVGQEHIVSVLTQSVLQERPSHAYLFSGPRGTGKTSTARLLAAALNCRNFTTKGDICGECDSCKSLELQNGISVIEIDAASNRGINEIRQLRESVNYTAGAGYKVYIIDEVHMLSNDAFNALLKTLEEPPAHVVFVLATTELHKVPATILSRVQHFQFKLGNVAQVLNKLKRITKAEDIELTDEVYNLIYELGEGSYRDSESILNKLISGVANRNSIITQEEFYTIIGIGSLKQISTLVNFLTANNLAEALKIIEQLDEQGVNWAYFLKQILRELKLQIISKTSINEPVNLEVAVLRAFSTLYTELKDVGNPRLAVETAVILLCSSSGAISSLPQAGRLEPARIKAAEETEQEVEEPFKAAEPIEDADEFRQLEYLQLLKKQNLAIWAKVKNGEFEVGEEAVTIKFTELQSYTIAQQSLEMLRQVATSLTKISLQIAFVGQTDVEQVTETTSQVIQSTDNSNLVEELF